MSGTIGTSSYSTLSLILESAYSLRSQYSALQEQTTTGLVSQSYSGLAPVSSRVLNLEATTARNTAYTQAITGAFTTASEV